MKNVNEKYYVLDRLTQAVFQLENAIISAKEVIQSKLNYPPEAIERLDHYMTIVDQQRQEFPIIAKLISEGNHDELSIKVSRVNALSGMIKDDAHELLRILTNPDFKVIRPVIH
jgi:hypothetical protein